MPICSSVGTRHHMLGERMHFFLFFKDGGIEQQSGSLKRNYLKLFHPLSRVGLEPRSAFCYQDKEFPRTKIKENRRL